ncbi:GFA family protein [Derxia gummosa]|uniref:GFA family protein n=1 Tax=Derxia gummosa DSM 723 TaxID=1121388 RepID=A0A8B6XDA3_9BURK|nr:GFA family protein [Derxia gummosa]
MTMHAGGCLCGGVRFGVRGELPPIQVCHCSQCRRAQGGPLATNLPLRREQLRFERGEALLRAYESSPGKRRWFCSVCGSPVFSDRDGLPGVVRLRAGLLDGPVAARPGLHQHVASACDWWPVEDDGLARHAGGVPPATA